MASEFLKKLAEEQAKGIEETFGAGTYGSTAYIPSQPNKGTMATPPVPQPAREEQRENIWQQAISAATPSTTEPEASRQAQRRSYASPTTERTRENRRLYGMDTTLPDGRYSQITIPEATTKNRTLSELYNDATTMNRWRELASKDSLSAEEKKEARAARQEIERAMRVPLSEVKWNPSMTQEEYQQRTELGNLNNALEVRSSLGSSFMAGAVHALGLDWLSDRIRGLGGDEFEKMTGNAPSLREVTSTAQKTSPAAYSAGNIAASAAEMISVGGAVGNAMKGVEWFAKAPGWIQRALSSGITFGLSGLQSGVTSTQTKEEWDEQERKNAALAAEYGQEYTPREYSVGRQIANVGISTATGALAGAAGGALETAFGIGTSRALIRNGLQYNTLFRAIASGINGVGFAAGSTAIQEASKYLQYPEGYTASASEITSNMAVAFLFSSVSSVISDMKTAPQNRENLLKMMDELTREYAEVEMKMAGMTGPARRETAQKVTELTARIRNSIATSRGMSGVSNEIKSLAAALDIIDDRMAPIIAGGNGLLGAGDIMAQAEAAGFNPNTTLRLPAWDGTPSQPTNLEQAVQIVGANVPAPMGEAPAIPEAPAPSENFPAWYTAYQNAPRPIDQPMQQRPNIPVPASRPATAPAAPPVPQSAQGNTATPPTPPVPQRVAERPTEAPLTLPGDRGTMEPAKSETPPLPRQTAKAPAVEEAKRELKGTIRMPVQGKNVDALEQGASTGELTMDSVTIGAKVPGFTREQQTSLAEQIIEGVQSGQKEITAKVPNDGTFTVTNQPGAVAQVLNGLKVKANQEIEITQALDKYMRGKKNTVVASDNERQFVGDGYAIVAVSKSAADYAAKEYNTRQMPLEKLWNQVKDVSESGIPVTEQPRIVYVGKEKQYAIRAGDRTYTVPAKSAELIDGGQLYVGNGSLLVSMNENGDIRGIAMMKPANIDTDMLKNACFAKLKGIGEVAQSAGERAEEPENTPALNPPKEPEAPSKAEAPLRLPTEQKGENNGQVDLGRGNAERGSDAGRRGSELPAEQPAEAEGLPRNGNRGEEQPGTGGEDAQGLRGNGAGRAGGDSGSVAGGDEGLSLPDDGGDAAGIRGKEPVKRPRNHNKRNYRLSQDIDSTRPSFLDNLAAIKLVKTLQKEGRGPTPEEMDVLAKYKGWGGLKTDVLGTGNGSYHAYQLRQVLTPEEYNDAKASVLNAHYTSTKVIDGIYSALTRMGFSGGNILEPSMGVGNFFGRLPEKFSKTSDLYGVELDSITGAIAQYLYPDAKIDVAGFQDVLYPDGTFDLVVGNVPFSNQIKIPYRGSSYNLHDFFFLKALDEMKPGGVAALITSTGTLDKINGKVQKEIADRANLIAAFRLPDDAFKTNAGTSVTTDLLFLQKKGDDILDNGVAFGSIGEINGIPVNEYYVDHPKNILGKLAREKGMYVSDRTVVHAEEGFQQRFEAAMKSLPKDIMKPGSQPKSGLVIPKKKGQKTKTEFKVTSDGAVVQSDGKATPVQNKKAEQTIKDYVQLKNTFNALIDAEKSGNIQGAEEYRRRLNEQYDGFTAKHGNLSDKNKKLLSTDDDFTKLSGLEIQTKDGISKSAIFTRSTISRAKRTSASSPQDALAASLNDTGKVDLPYMAKLTGRSVEDLAKDLEGDIVYTPDGDYVLTAQYVSGNIYEKLAALEGREGFEKQKKMLEAAIPRRKGPEEINASLGSHWIPTETYTEFLREVFGLDRSSGEVSFDPLLGKWYFPSFGTAVSKYDASGVATPDLVNQTLNGKNITVYVKDKDGKRHLDTQATTVAQAKQDQLRQDFENWVFADKKRAEMLSDKYNRTMNAYAPMDYAELAKMLDTGISEDAPKQPRDYQKTAVARVVFGGNTLLHHGVGTGKTITMIVSAHVMKHNGIIHKPMFVVPNGKVNDFRTEILDLYPDASVLALDNDSMTPAQIKRTKAQIATGDWDYVIIYHSAFERLGITPETQKSFIEEQIAEYEEALRASREESGQRSDTRFEKNLAAKLKNLEEKLKDLSDQKRDDSTYFEDMGIDALFVDEAHNFKKVGFPTTFQISGIESGTNGKTTDLYMKENWLRRQGGRIILGTATPITNTLSEMYNMALHVNPDVYRDIGIYNFDTWLNTFADISAKPEIGPDGKTWRIKERVRGFKNGNEMVSLYRQFADVIQTKDVVKGLPKAKYVTVVSEGTDLHQKLLDWFATRSGNPQGTDNMLLITSDGRAAGTDLRLLRNIIHEVDPTATEEMLDLAGSKLNKCVDRVLDEYHQSSNRRGTQLIFLDLGIKAKEGRYGGISLYEDLIDKLVKNGIPREEIANIQDYDGEEKRTKLYDDMNSGKKRILIGSTAKMGEGVNAQRKIVAIHQLSVPYRADNLEQQEGRAIRFGNENDEVRIYRYIQEKSYDSYMWQMIERKAAYMSQALAGGDATELEEVGDIELSARESKAIATGNPLIVEKMELQDKAEKLRILQKNFYTEQALARKKAEQYPEIIKKYENEIKDIDEDIQTVEKSGKDFSITLGKTTYTERKEAAEALGKILKPANYGKTIGKVHGLDIVFHPGSNRTFDSPDSLEVRGKHSYTNEVGESAIGNITRILNLAEDAPRREKKMLQGLIESGNKQIEDAKKVLAGKFEKQDELDKVTARQREVDLALGIIENEGQVEAESAGDVEDSREVDNFNSNTAPKHPENWKSERVGDKDKTPMSLTDLVNMIRHDFDIPVTTGNIRSPDARAQYRRQPQSIRSKIANSIPDIAHELGHHLDNIYDIRGNISEAAKQEIIDAMPESFKAAYKKEQLPGEGIAEFLRRYLQNSEMAAISYPKFSEEFFGLLSNKARATLDKLADEVNAYYALSEQTGNWPVHNREDKGRDYRGLGEKLKDMNTHFRTLFIDSLEPIKQFDDESGGNAYLFATNAAYAGNRAYAAITGDLYDLRANKLGVGLQKALEGIRLNNKKEYTDFGMYLICRHGPERLAEGMQVFADDAWDNTAFMEQTAEELAEKYPNFEEAAERLEEYQHELIEAYGVASGLYSQETIDAWMERWEHYVPFLRWFGETEKRPKGQKQSFANQTRIHGKAVGSGLEIINPVDNIIENTVRLITASIRNEVMQEITKAAAKMEGAGRWLEQVPMPLARKTWDGKGLKSKTLDEFDEYFKGKGKDLGKNALDLIQQILDNAIDDLLVQYGRGKAHGDIVTVMKNGKPEYWKVNDPDLLRSVTTMGPTRAGELLNYYGRVTRFITGNITGMNIVWSITSNNPRDIGTLFTFSRTKNIVKLLAGIGESYVNRIKGDKANELYKEFMAMGGNSTSAQTADKDMAKKARKALQKQKTDWLNPLEWVEFVSDMIEAGPRYSYYKICRTKYGMTPEEAFFSAMEITVNFKKAGVLSREINILVPFFNASIQGVDRAARWLAADDLPKEERKAGRTRRIGVYLGASLAIAALSMALNLHTKRKRDNLEKLSTYTKNNYFIVPTKNGKYVAIPKPRELAIPISLFERIMETYIGQNPHAFDDFWEYATDNTLPGVISSLAQGDLNSAIGDFGVLGTFHYLTSNQDFLGRPIVPDSLKKLEAKDQYDQNTSQLAKLIGQVFNASPKQMDFLGNNLFGGFWQWQKALAPVSGKADLTLGVQSKWVKDPLFSTDITNRMYDRRDKLEKIKNSNPEDIDAAAEYRTTSDLATFYGRYYRLAKNEEETPQSRVIREAMLDIILGVEQNAEVEPARKFLLDVVEQTGSTALMPTVMEVTVKSDGGTTYNLTAEEYFMHQTRYEALYYNYIRQATDNRPKMSDEEKVSTVEAAKKIAGIVARGEVVEDHGGTYKAYTKVKDLLEDGVSEGELINYLSAKDNADLDENGKVSNAELLHAAGALRIPANKVASLIDYSSSGNLGLKLRAVGDYGVDAEEYAKVLDALGEQTLSQANVVAAIDEVYGRTTTANRKEKAAMWQAMNKSWKAKNNPYDSEVGNKVSSGLKIPG